jgi:hypothetical protein
MCAQCVVTKEKGGESLVEQRVRTIICSEIMRGSFTLLLFGIWMIEAACERPTRQKF